MTEHQHASATMERHCDVAIIGGSASGLAAALQLARQRRTVLVVDDDTPRNAPAHQVHGYLGSESIAPAQLRATGRAEVRSYGGEILAGRALAVRAAGDRGFRVDLSGGHRLLARRVLAATGMVDELPDIEGLAEHWGRDVIHCPFCHGFEVRDRRLVQIVTHPVGLHPTPVLRHLSDKVTVVLHSAEGVAENTIDALGAAHVVVVRDRARRILSGPDGGVAGVELTDGRVIDADAVVVGPQFRARAEALAPAGVRTTPHASGLGDVVEVDETGQTAVRGLFAAGNLTDPSMQVLQAAAHGSRVGAMIAFSLAEDDMRDPIRSSGAQTEWDHRYGDQHRVWSTNPNGTLVAEVAALVPGRVLDVGAGEGADALWLAAQGWDVTASDVSGNALARITDEAHDRGLAVRCVRTDANDLAAFTNEAYDLVSMQYGSIPRTPDQRGLDNLLSAVAPGGTLLIVGHDLTPLAAPVDVATQTHIFDPHAYLGVDEAVAALARTPGWRIDAHETRPRPVGAISTHHVDDVVLRATKQDPSTVDREVHRTSGSAPPRRSTPPT